MLSILALHNRARRLQVVATGLLFVFFFFLVSDLLKLKAMVLGGVEP